MYTAPLCKKLGIFLMPGRPELLQYTLKKTVYYLPNIDYRMVRVTIVTGIVIKNATLVTLKIRIDPKTDRHWSIFINTFSILSNIQCIWFKLPTSGNGDMLHGRIIPAYIITYKIKSNQKKKSQSASRFALIVPHRHSTSEMYGQPRGS